MRRSVGAAAVTAAALALTLAGCGSDDSASSASSKPELKVSGVYMPAPVTDTMAAGFFTVTNSGGTDTLTSVTSDLSDDVTLHSTKGGAMEEEKSFAIPADGTLAFASGGNHLMFEKLSHRPREGEKVSLTLHFARTGTVQVSMPVKSATYNPTTGH
ncbi:copper chaperone PCu(A)C [Streptomyces sp. NPDC048448]|uniref:copper chaperone PCu(A)C n=1 Tax=unclassified Streptomyces TaxID=2593676 RepID=UPI002E31C29B|nr:copper chaperone PCu(A)C [Streptomyces sp. NBC_01455]